MKVFSIILAGGSGTRLWPLSRKSMPKQFLSLVNDDSFLINTCNRIKSITDEEHQIIITNKEHENLVIQQLGNNKKMITEKVGRNTAPAILAAALKVKKDYGNGCAIIVLPSDHLITNNEQFIENLKLAIENISDKKAITFGIYPNHPEISYGYIEVFDSISKFNESCYKIKSFKEKPDQCTAEKYIHSGKHLWNSGIFVFNVDFLINEYKNNCIDIFDIFVNIDIDNIEMLNNSFENCRSISIDYAIMEKIENAYVIPSDFGWSDVGTWKSIYEISSKDNNNNVIKGNCLIQNAENNLIISNCDRFVSAIGISNLCIIDTNDALLVSDLNESIKLNEFVRLIEKDNQKYLIENTTTYRPWGNYSVLLESAGYKVKKIVVRSGQKLSMQYHYHRSEHWTIVKGTAKVIIGNEEKYVYENQSVYIPKTVKHRLINEGEIPLEIIEVQYGDYLDEDDIVRIDDI